MPLSYAYVKHYSSELNMWMKTFPRQIKFKSQLVYKKTKNIVRLDLEINMINNIEF